MVFVFVPIGSGTAESTSIFSLFLHKSSPKTTMKKWPGQCAYTATRATDSCFSSVCLISINLNLWSDLVLASKQPRVRNTVWEEMVKTIPSLALRRPDLYLLKNCRLIDLAKSNNSCSFLRVTESENPKEKSEFFPCWRSWLMAKHRRSSGVVMKAKWVWTGWLNKWCSTAGSFPILLRNRLCI